MPLMNLGIVESRRRWFLTARKLAEHLSILFQKSVDHFYHLSSNTAYDENLPTIGFPSLIIAALARDQALIKPRPLTIKLDSMGDAEKKHLFHHPAPFWVKCTRSNVVPERCSEGAQ